MKKAKVWKKHPLCTLLLGIGMLSSPLAWAAPGISTLVFKDGNSLVCDNLRLEEDANGLVRGRQAADGCGNGDYVVLGKRDSDGGYVLYLSDGGLGGAGSMIQLVFSSTGGIRAFRLNGSGAPVPDATWSGRSWSVQGNGGTGGVGTPVVVPPPVQPAVASSVCAVPNTPNSSCLVVKNAAGTTLIPSAGSNILELDPANWPSSIAVAYNHNASTTPDTRFVCYASNTDLAASRVLVDGSFGTPNTNITLNTSSCAVVGLGVMTSSASTLWLRNTSGVAEIMGTGPAKPAPNEFFIVATEASKNEGNSGSTPFTFTVTRTGESAGAASVQWKVSGIGSNPADALDFVGGVLPSGVVTFAPGETTKTVTVNVAGDATPEADEGFAVTLTNPVGGILNTSQMVDTSIAQPTVDNSSGGYGITEKVYAIAGTSGEFTLMYDMMGIPDQADVYINSVKVVSTNGFVSNTGTLRVPSTTLLKAGDLVKVVITATNSGTAWNYRVSYPGGLRAVSYIANGSILNDDSQTGGDATNTPVTPPVVTPTPVSAMSGNFSVAANSETGASFTVPNGATSCTFNAAGTWSDGGSWVGGPEGLGSCYVTSIRMCPGSLGALIANHNGAYVQIGTSKTLNVTGNQTLSFIFNDVPGSGVDNTGAMNVSYSCNVSTPTVTPTPTPVSTRYAKVGNYDITECVKDTQTGLIWEGKTASGLRAGLNYYSNHDDLTQPQVWQNGGYRNPTAAEINAASNSIGYMNAVNTAGLCGFTNGWRMPTKDELTTLVKTGINPTIDAAWFPNTNNGAYWSSTPYTNSSSALFIDFTDGFAYTNPRDHLFTIRLVR